MLFLRPRKFLSNYYTSYNYIIELSRNIFRSQLVSLVPEFKFMFTIIFYCRLIPKIVVQSYNNAL